MILKDWFFEPSQKEIWGKLVDRFGGELIEYDQWSDFAYKFKYKTWSVFMDNYSTNNAQYTMNYTRIRTLIKNQPSLSFQVNLKSVGINIRKAMGLQNIQLFDDRINAQFNIRGNNENLIQRVFAADELRTVLLKEPKPDIWLHDRMYLHGDKCPEGIGQVYLEAHAVDRDAKSLMHCCELFCTLLDSLEKLNVGFEDEHEVKIE